ncbi:MAG: DUF3995 domain-containing protein [Ignavibacteria bacterium]|nr:DUF3995 domain-containing protein [Ignavibacteria bacterium]
MQFFVNILVVVNTLVFSFLSLVHVYWALGGKWGATAAIPETEGRLAFTPGKFITIVVATGLFLFAIISASNLGFFTSWIEPSYFRIGMWSIVAIFFLRAIGDFKVMGFSKKTRGTTFAKYDTNFYSPLCLYLASSSLIIILTN